jgi:DNA-binding beta-propeller fold protein YncE
MAYIAGFASSVIPVNLATGTALPPINLGVTGGFVVAVVITPDGRTMYVVNNLGYLVPVDTATRTAGSPIRIGVGPPDGPPSMLSGMLLSPDGRTGYLLAGLAGVQVVNLVTNEPGPFIKIDDADSFALTPDGRTLYVGNESGSEVTPVDTATLKTLPPIRTTSSFGTATSMAIAPDGRTLYVLGATSTSADDLAGIYTMLTPISTATNTALRPIQIEAAGAGVPITISPDSRTAYLSTKSGVEAVDLATGRVRWTIALGGNPGWQVMVSADSQTVYATSLNDSAETIYRLSAATGAQLTPINTGWHASDVVLGADGTLYVLSFGGMNPPMSGPWALVQFDAATGAAGPTVSLPSDAYPWTDLQLGGS